MDVRTGAPPSETRSPHVAVRRTTLTLFLALLPLTACDHGGPALTLIKVGKGSGAVTVPEIDLECPSTCVTLTHERESVPGGALHMRASALGNSSFGGWAQQCDDETGETCRFYMTTGQHDTVYAGFSVAPVDATGTLEISRAGTGSGNVASSASPIQGCAADEGVRCEVHRGGRPVVLRATPSFGSRFGGWSGDCEFRESATCALAVAGVRAVTATFTTVHDLTVTVNTGGSVTAISHGIDCPGACSAVVDGGESELPLTFTHNSGLDRIGDPDRRGARRIHVWWVGRGLRGGVEHDLPDYDEPRPDRRWTVCRDRIADGERVEAGRGARCGNRRIRSDRAPTSADQLRPAVYLRQCSLRDRRRGHAQCDPRST